MAWSTGTRLGPYEIVGPLGEGGMGQVWKARDTRLNRSVAVKQLNSRHVDRFEQEARAIAALNHPHICQIYDVGPDYLVLEYIDGQPIRGPILPGDAIRLGVQISGAIEAAHARGILHRDLKPANLLVTGSGVAKLLDFGLAKLMSADADVTRTTAGALVGTAAYMSPEQAEGRPLDARSDIFSFGAVFYEMLTGKRAFPGNSAVEVLNSVLREDPSPLVTLPALDRIVRRCLEKRPERRFQTMAEVRAALETTGVGENATPTIERRPSIAVLPFADMSAAKDQEWFGDGLAEEIINALTHIPGLKVIARTSAFAFKGQNTDVRQIAEALGVAHILEGSVRTSRDRLRVTAQLIIAADGSHLWSDRFDRQMTDVFDIQDEIAQAIASALRVELSTQPTSIRRHTPDLPAYEALLKGFFYIRKRTPESWTRAKDCFDHAIALDPAFPLAHASLGAYYFVLSIFGMSPARDAVPLAKIHAQKALDLDPTLAEALGLLGTIAVSYDYDWNNARRQYELAMAGRVVSATVRNQHGHVLLLMGQPDAAVLAFDRALTEDPLNLENREYRAFSLGTAGRLIESCREFEQVVELDDTRWFALAHLGVVYALRGMFNEGVAAAEKAHALAPWDAPTIGLLAGILVRAGESGRAAALIRQLSTLPEYRIAVGFLCFYELCDDLDQAADWAEKAIQQRHPVTGYFLQGPLSVALRSSPRWPRLASMMNLSHLPKGTEEH
jgi:serine/threonine-protein kinase